MRSNFRSTLFWALIGLVLIAFAPLFIQNKYHLFVLTMIAIYTILAVGLNLLMGYAGQVSLGHAAFFGLGAYCSAILTVNYHLSPWLAMPLGMLFTGGVAFLIGIPCLRLTGHYLAMATLGFGWIVYIVLVQWTAVTQGTSGIEGIPNLTIGPLVFNTDVMRFYLTWTATILVLAVCANVVNSRMGRALRALHSSESAAAALGVNVAQHKVKVFVLSAMLASLAGSLYAHVVNFISPSSFGFIASVEMVVMVVIGGMASVWGALVGASTITLLVELLRSVGEKSPAFKEFDIIAHGAILILVMIFMPAGLVAGIRDLILRAMRRRVRTQAVAPQPVKEQV